MIALEVCQCMREKGLTAIIFRTLEATLQNIDEENEFQKSPLCVVSFDAASVSTYRTGPNDSVSRFDVPFYETSSNLVPPLQRKEFGEVER